MCRQIHKCCWFWYLVRRTVWNKYSKENNTIQDWLLLLWWWHLRYLRRNKTILCVVYWKKIHATFAIQQLLADFRLYECTCTTKYSSLKGISWEQWIVVVIVSQSVTSFLCAPSPNNIVLHMPITYCLVQRIQQKQQQRQKNVRLNFELLLKHHKQTEKKGKFSRLSRLFFLLYLGKIGCEFYTCFFSTLQT